MDCYEDDNRQGPFSRTVLINTPVETPNEAYQPAEPPIKRGPTIPRKPLPPLPKIHPSVKPTVGITIEEKESQPMPHPAPNSSQGTVGRLYDNVAESEQEKQLAAERAEEKWRQSQRLRESLKMWGGGSDLVHNLLSSETQYHGIHGTNSNFDRRLLDEEIVALSPLIDNGEEAGDLGYIKGRPTPRKYGETIQARRENKRRDTYPRSSASSESGDSTGPELQKLEGSLDDGWDGPYDPDNPANWSQGKKLRVYLSVCLMCFFASNSVSLMIPSVFGIMADFRTTEEIATLALSLYLLGWTFGPLLWVPISEIYGKAPTLRWAWLPFIWFSAGSALSKTATQLLVTRSLAGVFSCAHVILGSSLISDIYEGEKAATLTGVFVILLYLSPSLAPLLSGYLVENTSWRWAFWFNVIQCAAVIPFVFMIPETHKVTILAMKRKRRLRSAGILDIPLAPGLERKRTRFVSLFKIPLKLGFTEPLMFAVSLSGGLSSSLLYLYFGVYPRIFLMDYHFPIGNAFAPFGAIVLGMLLAAPTLLIQKKIILKREAARGGIRRPEDQLLFGMIAAFVTPASIFWFAFTADLKYHWLIPAASGVPFGWGIMTLFTTQLVYVATTYSSMVSFVAATLFLFRNLLSATLPLAIPTMSEHLGHKNTIIVMGGIAAATIPVPLFLYKFGGRIRLRSALADKF